MFADTQTHLIAAIILACPDEAIGIVETARGGEDNDAGGGRADDDGQGLQR